MTDSNFQSFVPAVRNVEDIKNKVGEILSNQENVVRKTTPMESEFWSVENKKDFTLDLRNIDRLYYLINDAGRTFLTNRYHKLRMVGRIRYKEKIIYFEFFYFRIEFNFIFVISRENSFMYFSEDPFLFMDVICHNKDKEDECFSNIVKSLRLDRIVPNLSYMCQQKLYKCLDLLHIPLFVKKRLNIDRNVTNEAVNDYCDFRETIFDVTCIL